MPSQMASDPLVGPSKKDAIPLSEEAHHQIGLSVALWLKIVLA